MGAKKLKAKTTITQFEVQERDLSEITVLSEMFQTRAKIDKGFVYAYAKAMRQGSVFPPLIAYHVPDGRLILADGFHRFDAAESLGLTKFPTVIREGTVQDAILAGIAENFDPYHSRKVEDEDRRHAVEIMIRNEGTRNWPDLNLGKICGVGGAVVKSIRLRLRDTEDIPVPQRVMLLKDGKPTGRSRPYKYGTYYKPTITESKGVLCAQVNGKREYIGTSKNRPAAEAKLAAILSNHDDARKALVPSQFVDWLQRRSVVARGVGKQEFRHGGILVGGAILLLVPTPDLDHILQEIGRAVLATNHGVASRAIMVGFFGAISSHASTAVEDAKSLPDPIEFMTPDEVVAEFGPKPDQPPESTP